MSASAPAPGEGALSRLQKLLRTTAFKLSLAYLVVFAVFAAILFLIDIIEEIRRFGGRDIGLIGLAGLAALNITASLYGILPLLALLAGIALFLGLSRSSEMVAIRAAGRTRPLARGYEKDRNRRHSRRCACLCANPDAR